MLRFAELGLFFAPFALFAAWWLAGARASRRALAAGIILVLLLAALTVWISLGNRLPIGTTYMPAEWKHGVVVQGHGN